MRVKMDLIKALQWLKMRSWVQPPAAVPTILQKRPSKILTVRIISCSDLFCLRHWMDLFFADVIYLLSRLNKILEYEDLILGYFVNLLLFGWKIESNGREKMMEIIQREKRFNMWQKYFLPHKPPLKNQNISWKE